MCVYRANKWFQKSSFSTSLLMGGMRGWSHDRGWREEQAHFLLEKQNKGIRGPCEWEEDMRDSRIWGQALVTPASAMSAEGRELGGVCKGA